MKTLLKYFAISLLVGYSIASTLYVYLELNKDKDFCIPMRNEAQMYNGYETIPQI